MAAFVQYKTSVEGANEGAVAKTGSRIEHGLLPSGSTIAPGRFVRYTGTGDQIALPTSEAHVGLAAGVVTHFALAKYTSNAYVGPEQLPVCPEGVVWMRTEAQAVKGGKVYVRHTADGLNTVIGGVSSAAGTGLTLKAGAKFASNAGAGELVMVEVNLPSGLDTVDAADIAQDVIDAQEE